MRQTLSLFPPAEQHALTLDGVLWRDGSVIADSASPPLLAERASLVAQVLPDWSIAAGHTAGWVWTGLGHPEPWSLFRPQCPAISPLSRSQWRPRSTKRAGMTTHSFGALTLLTREATITDLLIAPGDDEVAAAQLYALAEQHSLTDSIDQVRSRLTAPQRDRARVRVARVRQWWRDYPDVTR